ncbi:uncharacterized protein KNAG_0B04740 [Huiozyma naganishii CBS 8797]|uniref:Aspartate/glutamate/uridylate kinase domain-containing protein n=1 Tax=Huiozyma naganishii (strain ATCC MYA-139 / BCRC 22969 / CBS 8797 / KCTC 17520 / NBRC 10181 / NCYC 3082 / Yp74L-3) TaxID=1071383 RepID=J7S3U3_HUIN7|nr:hypothetical protein KNAG_0B04740 [Kazachstania naganishii CBS 8797]CCK68909.1 hypothetical protein KNAG_0B04740 [Kazachstania naganishii CBS 8797]
MTGKSYTIVLKLGSSSLVDGETKDLKLASMTRIVETVCHLKKMGHRVVMVSSGGIAMGLNVMSRDKRPTAVSETQALAAIGQGKLIGKWDMLFQNFNEEIAQILLTRNDILNWEQFQNARNTVRELLDMNVIPIVNENDTLSISEIEFGDNDTLSGITASLIQADYLFLLTDVDCLYTNDPRVDPDAKPILTVRNLHLSEGENGNPLRGVNLSNGSGSSVGTGGMKTKIIAADLACNSGVDTVIMNSENPSNIETLLKYMETLDSGEENDAAELARMMKMNVPLHTKFLATDTDKQLESRQFWILHGLVTKGSIIIDENTYEQLNDLDMITSIDNGGLDVNGIIGIEDKFHELECVNLKIGKKLENGELDPDYPLKTVGRARVNYTSNELNKIKGMTKLKDIEKVLGGDYIGSDDHLNQGHGDSESVLTGGSLSVVASRENLALTPF